MPGKAAEYFNDLNRETSMHGPSMQPATKVEGERYDRSQDNMARLIVYFGPYVLWGSLGALMGLLFLLSG